MHFYFCQVWFVFIPVVLGVGPWSSSIQASKHTFSNL